MKPRIFVFSANLSDYQRCQRLLAENILDVEMKYCQSTENRMHYLKKNTGWVIFIDSDCYISSEVFKLMCQRIQSQQWVKSHVYTGTYMDPEDTSYLQKVHNFIANTWLRSHFQFSQSEKTLLGGAFAMYCDPQRLEKIESGALFWGGEDSFLARQLVQNQYEIQFDSDFVVTHATQKTWSHFLRRAFKQGQNSNFSRGRSSRKSIENSKYWFSELAKLNRGLVPAVLLHFLVLWLGRGFQKIRPRNNLRRLK